MWSKGKALEKIIHGSHLESALSPLVMLMRKRAMVETVDALSYSTQYFRHKSNRRFYRLRCLVCWSANGENGLKIFKGFKCTCRGLVLIIESFIKILFLGLSNSIHTPCCFRIILDAAAVSVALCVCLLLLLRTKHSDLRRKHTHIPKVNFPLFLIRFIVLDPERNLNVDTSTIKINFNILHSVIAQTGNKI